MKLILLLVCIQMTAKLYGQENDMQFNDLQRKIQSNPQSPDIPRVCILCDKAIYSPLDKLYFSAYYFSSPLRDTGVHSLYLVLIDKFDQREVLSRRYVLKNNLAAGSFLFPDSIRDGDFTLVGYTENYLSGIPEQIYSRNIFLRSLRESPLSILPFDYDHTEQDSLRLRYLVHSRKDGIAAGTKVDYVLYADSSLRKKGSLIANSRGEIDLSVPLEKQFEPDKLGLIMHVSKVSYSRTVQYPLTVTSRQRNDTPVLQVTQDKDLDSLLVDGRSLQTGKEYIFAIYNNKGILYNARFTPRKPNILFGFPVDSFPPGNLRMSLYDASVNKIADASFISTPRYPQVHIEVDSSAYHTRSKVTLRIKCMDRHNNAVASIFSLSCVLGKRLVNGESGIRSYFYPGIKRAAYADNGGKSAQFSGHILYLGKKLKKPVDLLVMEGSQFTAIKTDSSGGFVLTPEAMQMSPDGRLTISVAGESTASYSLVLNEPDRVLNKKLATLYFPPPQTYPPVEDEIFTTQERQIWKQILQEALVYAEHKSGRVIVEYDADCSDFVCGCGHWRCDQCAPKRPPLKGNFYYDKLRGAFIRYMGCPEELETYPIRKIQGLAMREEYSAYDPSDPTYPACNTTLYWEPFVKTNENGEARISFYTNDITDQFSVVCQGISTAGPLEANIGIKVADR